MVGEMNQLESVRAWLEKSCIVVPHDWIEACLEWIQEQNQGLGLRNDQLNNMVYEQWLMTDLRELNASCLPQQIEDASKVQLSGSYVLQVNSCVDVGIPYYGQLQKVRGTENANCQVSGEQSFQPAWQPKPSRMLMLKLTDGTLDVQGMEYQHIPQLKDVVPGTKILVQGHVLCRRGVLMLKSENVQVLGGEVDALIEMNTAEHILQSAMQDSSVHANKSERKQFSGQMISEGKVKPFVKEYSSSQSQGSSFVQHMKNEICSPPISISDRTRPGNLLPRQQMKIDVKKENNSSLALEEGNTDIEARDRVKPKNEEYEWCDDMIDPFMDDMDDFDIGNQTAVSESHQHYNISRSAARNQQPVYTSAAGDANMKRKGGNCSPGQPREGRVSQQVTMSRHNTSAAGDANMERKGCNSLPGQPREGRVSQQVTMSRHNTSAAGDANMERKGCNSLPGQPREGRVSQQVTMSRHSTLAGVQQTTAHHPDSKVNKQFEDYTIISSEDSVCDFEDDFDMEDLEMVRMAESCTGSSADISPIISNKNAKIKVEPCLDSVPAKRKPHSDFCSLEPFSTKAEPFTGSVMSLPKRNTLSDCCFEHNEQTALLIKAEPYVDSLSDLLKQDVPVSSCSEDDSLFLTKTVPSQTQARYSELSASKQRLNKSNTSLRLNSGDQNRTSVPKAVIRPLPKDEVKPTSSNPAQSTLERFLGNVSPRLSHARETPTSSVDTEFTYLSEALNNPVEGKVFLIKGYIATLTSKLTSRHGSEWYLACKVNDGSAVVDMNLSNKVLTKLIGFSAPDSLVMRQRAKNDPSVKDILTEGLQQCQQRLVDMSCLMEIQIGPGTSCLSVQRFIPVENTHILVLHHRVSQQIQTQTN